jgi:N-acyl-D-aspartate/D-glutamate deacylase
MAAYDLVIRGGTIVDGTGMPGFVADLAIVGNRIAAIGRSVGSGRREIDVDGHVVTPGFIDGHTHLDAQMFWDPLGTSSCWHGVTTAVVGNCGFTLAPSRAGHRHLVIDNLERAEDIPAAALAAGVDFQWETFREYLDAVDRTPKGINFAAYIGHSALRTYVMGERAFEERANEDHLAEMQRELCDALSAGAVGFTTSRSEHHSTPAGRPVASRVASWDEIEVLVGTIAAGGGGLFELANESVMTSADAGARAEAMARLRALAVRTRIPTMFGITTYGDPNRWQELLRLLDTAARDGGRLWGQSSCRPSGAVFNFATWMPFDRLPIWDEVRDLPLQVQARRLRDPDVRHALVAAAAEQDIFLAKEVLKKPLAERILVISDSVDTMPTLAELADRRGVHPVEAMIDLGLESDFTTSFFQVTGNDSPDDVQRILEHPRTVMTFSDAGAHVSQISNASLHTHLLSYWVRERGVFTIEAAIRMLTLVPSTLWGFSDRGMLREGFVADINVIDPVTVGALPPRVVADFPAGATRLIQRANGFLATVVGGQLVLERGEHTGALPGTLVRRRVP